MSSTLSTDTKINKDVPYGLTVAAAWSWRFVAIVVMLAVLWWLCSYISLVIIPVIVAALLAVLLAPVHRLLRRAHIPGVFAAVLCVVLLVAVVAGLAALAGQQIVSGFADLRAQLLQGVDQLVAWARTQGFDPKFDSAALDSVWNTVRQNSSTIVDSAVSFGSTATNVVAGTVMALFTLIFYLYDGERIWRFLLAFVPRTSRDRVDVAGRTGWMSLGSYVRVQIFVAFIDAVGIGLGALLLGVPLAIPLAVIVFLASFIPMVGAVLTGAIAVLFALAANGPVNALLMLAVVVLVQQIESNVLQPLVMGKAVSLHPLAVFLAVASGTAVMGLVGAVFAVPLLAFLNAFVRALRAVGPDGDVAAGEEVLAPAPHIIAAVKQDAKLDPQRDPRDVEEAFEGGGDDRGGRTGSTAARVRP